MLEDLSTSEKSPQNENKENPDIDEDWLNIFERYAEDASTERMQLLWGRVLSGEVKKPGKYSIRTLRILSELSQRDAEIFEVYADYFFDDFSPKSIFRNGQQPLTVNNANNLTHLEYLGLIQGVFAIEIVSSLKFDSSVVILIQENIYFIELKGIPDSKLSFPIYRLTETSRELLSPIPSRDIKKCAISFALGIRCDEIASASYGHLDGEKIHLQKLW